MYHGGASAAGSDKTTMQFYHTTPNPSSSSSSGVANFTNPLSSYSSIFFTPSPSDQSAFSTRTTTNAASDAASTPFAADLTASPLSKLTLEHRNLVSRHKSCLLQIQKSFKEAETLRQENTNLRVANCDLNDRLNRLAEAYLQNQYASMMTPTDSSSSSPDYATAPMSSMMEKFGGLSVREKMRNASAPWEGCESPTSVIESDRAERDVDRVSLPKSISVRSTGFLKTATQGSSIGTTAAPNGGVHRSLTDAPQKVYVRGGNKKDGPIELEVHNQGMFKTELCNKWQETGSCPYGEHCQFAHGFEELRPVLRHPRYKTEVCRMVLAGDHCPYGHRCHFRHALTEQEKLMVPPKLD